LPLPPANLVATARPGGSVQLNWSAPPGTVTYRCYQRDVTAQEQTFTERRLTVTGTAAIATDLTTGHHYEFVGTATNRAGEWGRSFPAPRPVSRAVPFPLPLRFPSVTFLSPLDCPRCESRYDAHKPQNLCACGSPLLARYDLDAIRAAAAMA